VKQSDRLDLVQVKSAIKAPRPFVYIFMCAKYGVDKSNAVIICSDKKVVPLVPKIADIVISFLRQQLC